MLPYLYWVDFTYLNLRDFYFAKKITHLTDKIFKKINK